MVEEVIIVLSILIGMNTIGLVYVILRKPPETSFDRGVLKEIKKTIDMVNLHTDALGDHRNCLDRVVKNQRGNNSDIIQIKKELASAQVFLIDNVITREE